MTSLTALAELRARIADIEGDGRTHEVLPFGVTAIDDHLPSGGIQSGCLHEIAGSPALADDAAATIFLAGMLARLEGPVLWCLRYRDLFAPALHLAGLHPDRTIHVEAGSDANVLLAMEECLRHAGIGAVVGEIGKCSTTATKRLQLAAEGSGVAAFLFRRAAKTDTQGDGSAAVTRWRILSAPSERLDIPSLGSPRWAVHLDRVRGGRPGHWLVEGCDAQGCIGLSAALVDRPAAAEDQLIAA
ncbi:MAG: damage-inducible mutagenesis protein [Pseudomonadota bacterium]